MRAPNEPFDGIDRNSVPDWKPAKPAVIGGDSQERVLRGERAGGISVVPEVTREDLKDPIPFRLNENFKLIAEQVTQSQGFGADVTVGPASRKYKGRVTFSRGADVSGQLRLSTTTDKDGNYKPMNVESISVFADNATAKAGGLLDGDIYRTATGQLMIVYT